jgi:hypothetical protein
MIRAHIRLNTPQEASEFVQLINSDGSVTKYTITDASGKYRVSARSLIGVIYAMTDFNDEMYLINETADGVFPHVIDQYRVQYGQN